MLGRVLGRGGFCVVNEITKIMLNDIDGSNGGHHRLDDEHHIYNIIQDRKFMSTHCIRSGRDYRYALKILQEASFKDPQTFVSGVVDLAVEARFLAVVRHPNIIKMRGMALMPDPFSNARFFLVLDRLYDTLAVRLGKWHKSQFKGIRKIMDRKGKKQLAFWVERLTVAYDLACALKYMHELRCVNINYLSWEINGSASGPAADNASFVFSFTRMQNSLQRYQGLCEALLCRLQVVWFFSF
jgi:hypothetical protein